MTEPCNICVQRDLRLPALRHGRGERLHARLPHSAYGYTSDRDPSRRGHAPDDLPAMTNPENRVSDEIVEKALWAFNDEGSIWALDGMRAALEAVWPVESVPEEDVAEALDAIDNYAARDMNHELHALVDHYRGALNVTAAPAEAIVDSGEIPF